jgi:hypothetical protein
MTQDSRPDDVVDQSSIGDPAARELRRRVPEAQIAEVLRRAGMSDGIGQPGAHALTPAIQVRLGAPRAGILEIWRRTAELSYREHQWRWNGRDALSDADQLWCLLLPAIQVETLGFDRPDATHHDVLTVLEPLGGAREIPWTVVNAIGEYLRRYDPGTPAFSADGYLATRRGDASDLQRPLEVVESFSTAVSLSLTVLHYLRVLWATVTSEQRRDQITELERLTGRRLTAAMVGLLRSFTVGGADLQPLRRIPMAGIRQLRTALAQIRAGLADLVPELGSSQANRCPGEHELFSCGWAWGVVSDAPAVETSEDIGGQHDGFAEPQPSLYFTARALEAIEDLFSERTRILGLLNEEQFRLAHALRIHAELARSYWSTIATAGGDNWLVEDLTRDSSTEDSGRASLDLVSIVIADVNHRRAAQDDVERLRRVALTIAAHRPADELHLDLPGSQRYGSSMLRWRIRDYSARAVRQLLCIASQTAEPPARSEILEQMYHAHPPLIGPAGSWYDVRRLVDVLIAEADLVNAPPLRTADLSRSVAELLRDAEQSFDRELLVARADDRLKSALRVADETLRRARAIQRERPGTAAVLASEVLRELDRLAIARQDTEVD